MCVFCVPFVADFVFFHYCPIVPICCIEWLVLRAATVIIDTYVHWFIVSFTLLWHDVLFSQVIPSEINNILLDLSEVADAATVGVTTTDKHMIPHCFVVSSNQEKLTEEDLRQTLSGTRIILFKYKYYVICFHCRKYYIQIQFFPHSIFPLFSFFPEFVITIQISRVIRISFFYKIHIYYDVLWCIVILFIHVLHKIVI